MSKYNHKALVNYYAKLIYKEIYKETDVPKDILHEVMNKVEELKSLESNEDSL